MTDEQLCWNCGRLYRNNSELCSWILELLPVDGWTAEKVPYLTYADSSDRKDYPPESCYKKGYTYYITECPKFLDIGLKKPKRVKKKPKIREHKPEEIQALIDRHGIIRTAEMLDSSIFTLQKRGYTTDKFAEKVFEGIKKYGYKESQKKFDYKNLILIMYATPVKEKFLSWIRESCNNRETAKQFAKKYELNLPYVFKVCDLVLTKKRYKLPPTQTISWMIKRYGIKKTAEKLNVPRIILTNRGYNNNPYAETLWEMVQAEGVEATAKHYNEPSVMQIINKNETRSEFLMKFGKEYSDIRAEGKLKFQAIEILADKYKSKKGTVFKWVQAYEAL